MFYVSVSIGVSEFTTPKEIEVAYESADDAAYASKHAGKGTVSRASQLAPVAVAKVAPA